MSKIKPAVSMAIQLTADKFPPWEKEIRFHVPRAGQKKRQWRFDFAWPEIKVALEVEGGTFAAGKSRHTTGIGYGKDCEKYSVAAIQGWIVVRVDTKMIKSGLAIELAGQAIEAGIAREDLRIRAQNLV